MCWYAVRASGPSPSRVYVEQTKVAIESTVMASSIFSFLHFAALFKIWIIFPLEAEGRSVPFKKEDTSPKVSWTWLITYLLHHLIAEYDGEGKPVCVVQVSLVLGLRKNIPIQALMNTSSTG